MNFELENKEIIDEMNIGLNFNFSTLDYILNSGNTFWEMPENVFHGYLPKGEYRIINKQWYRMTNDSK